MVYVVTLISFSILKAPLKIIYACFLIYFGIQLSWGILTDFKSTKLPYVALDTDGKTVRRTTILTTKVFTHSNPESYTYSYTPFLL